MVVANAIATNAQLLSQVRSGKEVMAAKAKPAPDTPKCVCGKTVTFYSSIDEQGFCSDECYQKLQRSRRGPEEAHIHFTSKGECLFQQGDILFHVDSEDLNKVVGANGETSVIDKLMDSQIVSLATANGLPVRPYVRELVRKPLIGLVQLVWYRDIQRHESDHLNQNQRSRIVEYHRKLSEYKEPESQSSETKSPRIARQRNWSGTYKFTGKSKNVASGRETQLLEVVKKLKQATLAQIVEAAKGKLQTKQDFQAIVTRFLKELIAHGAVEEVKG